MIVKDQSLELKRLVVTEELIVKHPNSKYRVQVEAREGGIGLWVGNDKIFINLQCDEGATQISMGSDKDSYGHAFSVFLDMNGDPVISLKRRNEAPAVITLDQLKSLGDKTHA